MLFPGYIFVYTSLENYSALKYTMGIKNIIKFGNNIPCVSQEDVTAMKMAEETSKLDPISSKITIGQEAIIKRVL